MNEEAPWWKNAPAILACLMIAGLAYSIVSAWNDILSDQRSLVAAIEDERNDRVDWQNRHNDDIERRRVQNAANDAKMIAALERIEAASRETRQLVERDSYRINSLEQAAPRDQAVMGELQKAVNTLTNAVGLLTQRIDGLGNR
jgi:hypothetical protein